MALRHRLLADARGASTAEYAAILALIGAALAFSALHLSREIACSMEQSSTVIAGDDSDRKANPKGKAKGHNKHCKK